MSDTKNRTDMELLCLKLGMALGFFFGLGLGAIIMAIMVEK